MKETNRVFWPGSIPALAAPVLAAVLAAALLFACTVPGKPPADRAMAEVTASFAGNSFLTGGSAGNDALPDTVSPVPDTGEIARLLEEIAELERAGRFLRGMGLAESGLRERTGDYAGAVAATFKELAWAYGRGELEKTDLEQGLNNILAREGQGMREAAVQAARGLLAFTQKRWDDAEQYLSLVFDETAEPDGFIRWVQLSCALEKKHDDQKAGAAYKAIRSRYTQFPEYWYRGARYFSGAVASEYAERCINLAPAGPFAAECRVILAFLSGLKAGDGASLKSKTEIEALISQSVNSGNPELLEPLIPLIALPENPYTVYTLGALKSLASLQPFRDYFGALAVNSRGRLADRLSYLCRG